MNTFNHLRRLVCSVALGLCAFAVGSISTATEPLKILFLGDQGHHRPADLAGRIVPALKTRGIEIQYTEDVNSLSSDKLAAFDGLLVYANIDEISPSQEKALLEFVASGKGFIPLHCATYCFRNSEAYVELCGAQFQSHGGEVFETVIVERDHPIMKGFGGFRSWDETYVHTKHNEKDRVVLEVRRQGGQARGRKEEPWTWVRTHGKGRVFYTAWGHDARTWEQPGFHNLLERGIRWACNSDPQLAGNFSDPTKFPVPKMTEFRKDVKPFSFTDVGAKIPNYTPSDKWGVQGEPLTLMQDPLSPEESAKHYITPENFEAVLWASEPDLQGKPIAMNWDDRGRLWLCESYDYPNELQSPGKGRDSIRICEDTNGDGKADKFTVFADKLSIPTAIVCYRGGALVQDGQKTIFLKDIDGDDKADIRQELITGWAIGDTHGGVSNFQYGLDNWIWAMQGYNDSHPVINGEEQQGFRQGFWRFRVEPGAPDKTAPVAKIGNGAKLDDATVAKHTLRVRELEFVRATDNNTWGIGISEEGLIFGSTANRNPSNFMPIPNRYYEQVKGWSPSTLQMISDTYKFSPATDKIRQVDQHGGYTAAAGHALYTARAYPREWWNRLAFVCEPTGHLIGAFVLNRDGAGYKSTSPFNLLASDDEWAAPIMAEVGPDGMMWVSDWYNYIVQHNPTPHGFETGRGNAYESDLRDKKHGRIYRVVYKGQPEEIPAAAKKALEAAKAKDFAKSNDALIQLLAHPTMRWRLNAQHLLIQRGAQPETIQKLIQLVNDPSVDEVGLNPGAIHALWTLHGLGQVTSANEKVLKAAQGALAHKSAGVRRAAIHVLPNDATSLAAVTGQGLAQDSDPQVRLAALLKFADCQGADKTQAENIAKIDTTLAEDRWLLDAWTAAAASQPDLVLATLIASDKAVPNSLLARIRIVAEHLARSKPTGQQVDVLLQAMQKGSESLSVAVLEGITAGWQDGHDVQISAASGDALIAILDKLPVAAKGQVVQLASHLGADALKDQVARIAAQLFELMSNDESSIELRLDAAKQLVALQPEDDGLVTKMLDSISPQTPSAIATGILNALVGSKSKLIGPSVIERFADWTPDSRGAAVRLLMARPETTLSMLEAMKSGSLQMADLQLDQRQALRDHPNTKVKELALSIMASGGGVPDANRVKILEEWMVVTTKTGEATRGKEVYKKHCALCHQHSGEGVNIGPDLTGMAVHPKAELLTNILDPNRSVEGNFRTYTVLTSDGVVMTGMLAASRGHRSS